jgi:hypothetical protein
MARGCLRIAVAIGATALSAFAASISVVNPSFEADPQSCAGCFTLNLATGWSATGQSSTFQPSAGSFASVPNGINVGAAGSANGSGDFFQTLSAVLQANTAYALTVEVGQRLDFPFGGYVVELLAGSVVLASDSSLSPARGAFLLSTVVYNSGSSPAQLGQALAIHLTGKGPGQADFDSVALDAVTGAGVPEPASPMLVFAAISLLAYRFRRVAHS